MPELPEVETTRRHIEPALAGRRIVRAELGRERMARRNERPGDVVDRLVGRAVVAVRRKGKFILIDLEGDMTWVIHLGMSGRLRVTAPGTEREKHTHLLVETDLGDEIRFIDPRTFGFVAVFTPNELETDALSGLGPDAWEELPEAAEMSVLLRGRTAPIKALLLDQRILSGLGNIYADEVLFLAGVRPTRRGGRLTRLEVETLMGAIPTVLAAGIEMGGTSLDDLAYLLPDGRAGEYLDRLAVYGRGDEPCYRCGTAIKRVTVAQRSSHYCPTCQK